MWCIKARAANGLPPHNWKLVGPAFWRAHQTAFQAVLPVTVTASITAGSTQAVLTNAASLANLRRNYLVSLSTNRRFTASVTIGSNQITGAPALTANYIGYRVIGFGIPAANPNATPPVPTPTITAINGTTLTLSTAATNTNASASLSVLGILPTALISNIADTTLTLDDTSSATETNVPITLSPVVTDALASTAANSFPGLRGFCGGVLLQDKRVFCVPHNSTTARIFNPVDDTVTTPAGTYPGLNAFFGGVLLQDGRVFCVPFNSSSARIYDPVSNTVSTPNGTYPGANSSAFSGGVLLPDGRVFCAAQQYDGTNL